MGKQYRKRTLHTWPINNKLQFHKTGPKTIFLTKKKKRNNSISKL